MLGEMRAGWLPTLACQRALVYRPKACHVDRVVHSKRMLRIHRTAMIGRCDQKNARGMYVADDAQCRALWQEMLDAIEFLRDRNELGEHWDFAGEFIESL